MKRTQYKPSCWMEIQLLHHRCQHISHEIKHLKELCDRKQDALLQRVHMRAMMGVQCVNKDNQTGSVLAANLQR